MEDLARAPKALLVLLVPAGLYGMVAPYAGRALNLPSLTIWNVPPGREVGDHVVPAVLILAVAVYGLISGKVPLIPALGASLAGLWMTATHLPLLLHAYRGLAPVTASIFHTVPGVACLAVSGALAIRAYREASPVPADQTSEV